MRSGANGRSKLELKMCDDESSEPSINKNYAALAFYVKPKRRQMILLRDCHVRCSLLRMSVLLAMTT